MDEGDQGRATSLLERASERQLPLRAAQLVAALAIFGCLYTMFGRLGYDCELEWMTGSIYDHIERMREGKPVYTPPTMEWTPFLYPPLYYAIVARLTSVMPMYLAARGVSILATFVQAGCIWRLAARHGATPAWRFLAIGVFAGAFANVSFWYDLERVDPLFVAMMAVGVTILVERRGVVPTALAGALMGLGFFAKQPALVFLAGGAVALAMTKRIVHAVAFSVSAALVLGVGFFWMQATTDGWFAYYVLKMPGAHGVVPSLFKLLFFEDVPKAFALVFAAAFFCGRFVLRYRKGRGDQEAVFAATLAVAAFASGSSRVHLGGWDNVLMFFITFACAAIAVVGTDLSNRWSRSPALHLVPFFAAMQIVIWAYDPAAAVPPRHVIRDARAFEARVRALEKDGEVVVLGRGHVTTPRHAHHAAIIDVFRTEKKIGDAFARPFRERRYAAVVIDNFNDLQLTFLPELREELFKIVMASYYVAERLPAEMPDAHAGFHTHPRLVLRPRTEPLDEKDVERNRCLARTERTLAETRERSERGGAKLGPEPNLEAIARASCARAIEGTTYPEKFWVPEDPMYP